MTEKEKIETRKWAIEQVSDLSRRSAEMVTMEDVIKASDKIYDWVIDVKKK
jgi:hypothetical protein